MSLEITRHCSMHYSSRQHAEVIIVASHPIRYGCTIDGGMGTDSQRTMVASAMGPTRLANVGPEKGPRTWRSAKF